MSLENSITELAAAIRMLAEGMAGAARANAHGQIAAALGEAASAVADVVKSDSELRAAGKPDAKDQELEKAVAKVEADAKKSVAPAASAESTGTPAGATGEAKKPAGAADTQTSTAADTAGHAAEPDSSDAAPLDYAKDVTPKLMAFIKANGKEKFLAVLKEFNVTSGAQLKPEQYPAVLAAIGG